MILDYIYSLCIRHRSPHVEEFMKLRVAERLMQDKGSYEEICEYILNLEGKLFATELMLYALGVCFGIYGALHI